MMRLRFWLAVWRLAHRQIERQFGGEVWYIDRDGNLYRGQDAATRAYGHALFMANRLER